MKRTLALVGVILILFTACNSTLPESEVLTVRYRTNGKTLSIGNTREEVNAVTGGDEANINDFTEDGVQRVDYWDAQGVFVDFLDDKVVALRLSNESKWEAFGGIRVGMDRKKVEELFANNTYVEEGQSGGMMLSYDKDLNPIAFSPESPYYVVISFDEDKVSFVLIQDNFEE